MATMDVAAYRKSLNLTQAKFAEQLGVSPGHVGDLERGHRRLTIRLASKLEDLTKQSGIIAAVVAEQTKVA